MTPEKLHLALNHFVFLLPLAALLPLLVGLLTKSRVTILSGTGVALLGSLMTGLVMGTGEEAYERYEEGPIASYLDAGAEPALEHHEEIAHNGSKVMYALAAVSLATLAIGFVKKAWLPHAAVAVILFCLASVVAGLAIAESGGEIRRPDFRKANALIEQEENARHLDDSLR